MLNIISATIITGSGPDRIYLRTNLPEPIYPFKSWLTLHFVAASGTGSDYVTNHFGNINLRVVTISK